MKGKRRQELKDFPLSTTVNTTNLVYRYTKIFSLSDLTLTPKSTIEGFQITITNKIFSLQILIDHFRS